MPLTEKGAEILSNMRKEHGEKQGTRIFYASRNAGTIAGVDAQPGEIPSELLAEPAPIRAAGVICMAPDGCVLMLRRADSGMWAYPGGHIEDGETAEQAARRELYEETGYSHAAEFIPWTRRCQNGVDFTTFLAKTEEFCPKLDEEHTACHWVDCDFAAAATSLLHPGVGIALARFNMDEVDVAKAIRDGELTSPQRYGNLLLVALRITGTGLSYRSALKEYVWRDPAMYMTPQFLERCNGLFVIMNHPDEKPMLDSAEFGRRVIGTCFLPYFKGADEVWSIAKVIDAKAGDILESEQMSTSPGVAFFKGVISGTKYKTDDGSVLLIENEPSILDHIAICPRGVWDKGGSPAGVESIDARVDSNDNAALDLILHKLKMRELVRLVDRL